MNKQEYWSRTYAKLSTLLRDPIFNNNLSQVRARAIQEELSSESPDFTFNARKIWKYCDYILSEGTLLLKENVGDRRVLLQEIHRAGQTFEYLGKFAEGEEKESLLLNSAMCYHIAGYQANAICITRLVERLYLSNDEDVLDGYLGLIRYFREALVKFLKRDISGLRSVTQRALFFINDQQPQVAQSDRESDVFLSEVMNLTAHAYFHNSLSQFYRYCLGGEAEDFQMACDYLETSKTYYQKIGDIKLATLVSETRSVLDFFEERSTWTNIARSAKELLEERIWHLYLRNLAFDRSIVEFWLSQIKAISSGLLTANDGFVIQMPTSAGKTLIAELSILAALSAKDEARCLYIAPYRALVNEIEKDLAGNLGALGYKVSNLIGGFEFDNFQDFLIKESHVLVATPEKVELLLRTHPEYFQQVAVVVIDEGHILDEGVPSIEELREGETLLSALMKQGTLGRGALLELLVTRLRNRLPETRFLFLSAVMPEVNVSDFITWLSKGKQQVVKTEPSERPSRQVIARFSWQSEKNGRLDYVNAGESKSTFVPYFIQRQSYRTGQLTPGGKPQTRLWPDSKNKAQSTAMLASRFAETGPVLVFCAQPSHVKKVTEFIVASLGYLECSGLSKGSKLRYVDNPQIESYYLALEWLGEEHILTKSLHYGVGLHYGPLPDPVRQAVEDDFKNNKIDILVSTNTLGQGVNLPIKTVIIYSLERRWGQRQQDTAKIKKRDFWNICGRAGRAGKETEGHIVFPIFTNKDEELFSEYWDSTNLEEVNSALYTLLRAITERRINEEELIGYLDSHVLAILAEEIVDTQDEDELKQLLGTSLVGIQALKNGHDITPLVRTIKRTSSWILEAVPDQALRKIFSSTGLCVESCSILEREATSFVNNLPVEHLIAVAFTNECDEALLGTAFTACKNLKEIHLKPSIEYNGPEDELQIIQGWISGKTISELRGDLWEPTKAEDFSEYIADRLIYKLPWGFNGFLSIVGLKLKQKYGDLEDLPSAWQYLSSMVKFGVNKLAACWAGNLGISSRRLAIQLGNLYIADSENLLAEGSFTRWFVNLPDRSIDDLNASEFEKRRLLEVRNRIIIGRERLDSLRRPKLELESPVMGIPYYDPLIAANVREGDELVLKSEPDNRFDPNAIQVIYGDKQIGYVERDKAQIIARELRMGSEVEAQAKITFPKTERSKFPVIYATIKLR